MNRTKTKDKSRALVDLALRLAVQSVDALNNKTWHTGGVEELQTTSRVFEQVRKRVIREIVQSGDSSLSFSALTEAYVFLLDQRLSFESGRYELVFSENEKRRYGVFYTPDLLAKELVSLSLSPKVLSDFEDQPIALEVYLEKPSTLVSVEKMLALRIVDPAMGAGTILLATLEVLTDCILARLTVDSCAEDWNALAQNAELFNVLAFGAGKLKSISKDALRVLILQVVAKQCLYGLDLDPAAVDLAKIGLALRCEIPLSQFDESFPNLRCGNALLGLSGFDDKSKGDLECLKHFAQLLGPHWDKSNSDQIAAQLRIFHWDQEFVDVFSGDNPGFDLVLTNPPWEIEKVNSREFFSRFDPEYMTLSKQAALERQKELMSSDLSIRREWKLYTGYQSGLSDFIQEHAEYQGGGDANAYKLFLERGYQILNVGGVMAQIVPSGIYSDKGATALRRLFIDQCRWLFLRGFHNREGIFDIHRSFKFCTLGVLKGGLSNSVACDFLRVAPGDQSRFFSYSVKTLTDLSPHHLAFLETPHSSDLAMLQQLAETCRPLGSYPIGFRREFDMTNDSKLFVERSVAQKQGYALDCFGHWLQGAWRPIEYFDAKHEGEFAPSADGMMAIALDDIRRVLLPVYEGRMVGQYDWAKKAWLQGKGRRAEWAELPFSEKNILPQYLLDLDTYIELQPHRGAKVAYLAVGASTNSRSCIAAMIGDWPCGNAVPVLTFANEASSDHLELLQSLLATLNSFVFDFLLRLRLSANNLNWFILKECLVPDLLELACDQLLLAAILELGQHQALYAEGLGKSGTAQTELVRRMKLRAFVEAVIAESYGLQQADCEAMLRGCAVDDQLAPGIKPSSVDKGFHRLDQHLPPDLRAPALFRMAFLLLQERGESWLFDNLHSDDVLFSRARLASVANSKSTCREVVTPITMASSGLNLNASAIISHFSAARTEEKVGVPRDLLRLIRNAGSGGRYSAGSPSHVSRLS